MTSIFLSRKSGVAGWLVGLKMQVGGQFHGEVLINPSPCESDSMYTMGRSGRLWIANLEPVGENERSDGHMQSPLDPRGGTARGPTHQWSFFFFAQWPAQRLYPGFASASDIFE